MTGRRRRWVYGVLALVMAGLGTTAAIYFTDPLRGCLRILAAGRQDEARRCGEQLLAASVSAGKHRMVLRTAPLLYADAFRRSRYKDALRLIRTGDAAARAVGDQDEERMWSLRLCDLFAEMGDLRAAARALQKAKAIGAPMSAQVALRLQLREAILAVEENQPLRSLELHLQALKLAQEESLVDGQWAVRLNLSELLIELDRPDEAAIHDEEAEKLYQQHGQGRWLRGALLQRKAAVARARGERPKALRLLEEARGTPDLPDGLRWTVLSDLGRVAEELGDDQRAAAAYEEGVTAVEAMRASLDFHDLKVWMGEARATPLRALFALHARKQRAEPALAALERAQARTFLDAFHTEHRLAPETGQQITAAVAYRELLGPFMQSLQSSPVVAPRPLSELLLTVASDDLLYFGESGDEMFLLSIRRGKIDITPLPISRGQAAALIANWLENLDDPARADKVTEALLPLPALPRPGGPLIVIPSPTLSRLPFAALRPGGRLLVERHALSVVPSLNALHALRSNPGRSPGAAVVLGDPGRNLPSAAAEAQGVAARLGVSAILGPAATSARLRSASGASLLHVSAHSGLDATGPWLAMADRRVTAADILAWKVRPEGAVLASCASAGTRMPGLWGSLAASLLAAGSRWVVASNWSVADETAHQLALAFYAAGGAGDPVGGMARAQRTLARRQPPSRWASFVVYGAGHSEGTIAGRAVGVP